MGRKAQGLPLVNEMVCQGMSAVLAADSPCVHMDEGSCRSQPMTVETAQLTRDSRTRVAR